MREIKFRVWDKEQKSMKGDRMALAVLGEIPKHLIDEDWSVMQYTGLKDKDEKDIYEKDIIETEHISYNVHGSYEGMVKKYGVVEFNYGKFGLSMTNGGFEDISFSSKYHKIIGNIYSNPELLTKE